MSTIATPARVTVGDVPLGTISEGVGDAKAALLAIMAEQPHQKCPMGDLLDQAQQDRSESIVSIAFWGLVSSGDFRLDDDLYVYLVN